MELQDLSRLNQPPSSQPRNLAISSDGRFEYTSLSSESPPQPTQPSSPLIPSAPMQPSILQSSQSMDALISLTRWAKWVKILSSIFLSINLIIHLVWTYDLFYPPKSTEPPGKLCVIIRVFLFIFIIFTAKSGLKAAKTKSSESAKKYLGLLVISALLSLVVFGVVTAKGMKKAKKYSGRDKGRKLRRFQRVEFREESGFEFSDSDKESGNWKGSSENRSQDGWGSTSGFGYAEDGKGSLGIRSDLVSSLDLDEDVDFYENSVVNGGSQLSLTEPEIVFSDFNIKSDAGSIISNNLSGILSNSAYYSSHDTASIMESSNSSNSISEISDSAPKTRSQSVSSTYSKSASEKTSKSSLKTNSIPNSSNSSQGQDQNTEIQTKSNSDKSASKSSAKSNQSKSTSSSKDSSKSNECGCRRYHRYGKGAKENEVSAIFGIYLFVGYSLLIFFAYRLYRAARNYELILQDASRDPQLGVELYRARYPSIILVGPVIQNREYD